MSLDDAPNGWTGGGDWEPYEPPPPPRPSKRDDEPDDGEPGDGEPEGSSTVRPGRAARGLVVGRFDPPHAGHGVLLDVARQGASEVSVALIARGGDRLPPSLRAAWLREHAPDVSVVVVPGDDLGKDTGRLAQALRTVVPGPFDRVFGSSLRARDLSQALEAELVLVDPQRAILDASATVLLAEPMQCFGHVLPPARPFVVRRIGIHGASGSGKTTLARALAQHYRTSWVPEHARAFHGVVGPLSREHVSTVADMQLRLEDAAARVADRVLLCDTGPAQIVQWSQERFRWVPPWIEQQARSPRYDLVLLAVPHAPSASSERAHDALRELLGPGTVVLRGTEQERLAEAVRSIDALLGRPGFLSRWGRFQLERKKALQA